MTLARLPRRPAPVWLCPRTGRHVTLAVGDRVTFVPRYALPGTRMRRDGVTFTVRTWGESQWFGAYVAGAFWSCLVQDIRSVEREGEGLG